MDKSAKYSAILWLAIIGMARAAETPLSAKLTSGHIEGVMQGRSVAFLGVPFAAPPVGAARWRPPGAVGPWTGVRMAKAFAPSCPQTLNPPEGRAPWTPEYLIPGLISEDCLYLNVWRSVHTEIHNAPILVWFHGGGYVEGSGSVPVYNGAALASEGIVVVTINYRLGVLGFLAHSELSHEQGGVSGNYGVLDMLAALRWVQANGAAFGGDPARVTIAGQSAGSNAVNVMAGAPTAKGLFSRCITESGSGWSPSMLSLTLAESQGQSFAAAIGTASLAALRAAPAAALVEQAANQHVHFGAIVDGHILPADPVGVQAGHDFNDTPVLSGFNADEDSGMDSRYGQWTVVQLARKRDALFGPVADQAAKFYSASDDTQAREVGKTMMREHSRAYSYEWARRRAAFGRSPIYLYYYEHAEPGPTQARYGTFHTAEVPYVFGNLQAPRGFTNEDRQVSQQMMTRWLAFIRDGSPNAPGLPEWPPFQRARPMLMHLGDKEGPEPVLALEKLRLSDEFVDKAGAMTPLDPK